MPKSYGFIAPRIEPEDYFLGSGKLGSVVLNPSGDWRPYLPVMEKQNRGFEPNSCVSFATLSALEMLHKLQYKSEPNYSDRYLAKLSGTDPNGGNTPKKVADTLRHSGTIPETEWPYDNLSLENYYKDIPQRLIDMGAEWLKEFQVGYEYVISSKLKEALQRSPVACAVNAWSQNDKGEYIRLGASNHYVVLVAYDDLGRPIIWDSYDTGLKTLEKNYELEFTQLYTLKKKDQIKDEYYSKGFFGKMIMLFKQFLFFWK